MAGGLEINYLADLVVESLDTSAVEAVYQDGGGAPYLSKMMLRLLFDAYTKGIFSRRTIEKDTSCHGGEGVMQITFLTTDECCELLRCERDKLKSLRQEWISGVHYTKLAKGPTAPVRYIKEMILDWTLNQDDPDAHQRAIELFRRSLPSGKRRSFP